VPIDENGWGTAFLPTRGTDRLAEYVIVPGHEVSDVRSVDVSKQDGNSAFFTVTVQPTIQVRPASGRAGPGRPGDAFEIVLRRFSPGQAVWFHVLRQVPGGSYRYVTSLPSVRADSSGQATATFRTQSDDPTGRYAVIISPRAPGLSDVGATFELAR
jgi:hypothetical protein